MCVNVASSLEPHVKVFVWLEGYMEYEVHVHILTPARLMGIYWGMGTAQHSAMHTQNVQDRETNTHMQHIV